MATKQKDVKTTNMASILPTLISGAHTLVTQMKEDSSTDKHVTKLLGKASTAIASIQRAGLKESVAQAASILKDLPIDASHPLAQHADVAKCGLEFAQKYIDLVQK